MIGQGSTSSVGPPPTPIIQPPTPAVDPTTTFAVHPTPTFAIHPSPPPAAHPSTTPIADPLPPPVIITPTPPPIVITPTPLLDPTSIPSSSSVLPSKTVTPPTDPDSSGDGEGLDPPLHDRPWIEPYGKGFIPSRMKVQWKSEHDSQIHKNFHMKASHRLLEMFRDARNVGQRPNWLGEHIWNSLMAHWNTVEFRNKCAKAQRNRASERGGTLHTGGSITIHEHAIRMEEFSMRLSQVRSEHESAPTPDDANNADHDIRRTQCWIDIVGGKKKGRVYGAGQLAANYTTSRGGTLKHQPSSSTSTPDEVVLCLTQALEQRDQEITDLKAKFTNFKALVMRVLPETSQDVQNIPPTQPQPSSSPAATQQPTSVQPSSVQPTPVQPSIEEQDDEDHSDDSYVHY
ncbi:hypothetical protein LR48_Vigan09g085500 [Vigna angularis]|uniref:Transposase, Ptta/En/Spm, plant n=1 Tax=Phaseolus angularis TaxID=3914 RepID=A0A0L9VAV1_PHAAN|nr:hypothetical protein LR48_Vigan09g085500 [Vigna angularis]